MASSHRSEMWESVCSDTSADRHSASPYEPRHSSSTHSGLSQASEREPTGFTVADALSVDEFGRQFNAYREGKYLLPNDGDEQDRLGTESRYTMSQMVVELVFGARLTGSDIGTGTGIWAKQFAREHPRSNVIGTDLSLIQPDDNNPPNLVFEREDSEEAWIFGFPFDYIHWRLMCTCFNDIKSMITRVFEHLVPGGWAEFQDAEFEVVGENSAATAYLYNSPYYRWFRAMVAGGASFGRDFRVANKYKSWMMEAGFVNVVEKVVFVPVNGWPVDQKDQLLGKWHSLDVLRFLDGSKKILQAAGYSLDQIPGFLEEVRDSSLDARLRCYVPHYIVYGQRPEVPIIGGA
ncbi:hypothetical protein N0V93_006167 [Gnomoniopsis smithogilvyi]|uniref:Methyltransferase n=1 Tax=Gnomoniopsis smithogilvyi TaxID=1191159 RepID=A0A9W8YR63_9PEZI|nr:hypothetical protein N0V93_006167 [Gnomoniopsis smithogilvyi]